MSLAPALTVSPRSSSVPAAVCAPSRKRSKVLRACSTLASAIDRILLGISNCSRMSSAMNPSPCADVFRDLRRLCPQVDSYLPSSAPLRQQLQLSLERRRHLNANQIPPSPSGLSTATCNG